MAKPSPNYAGDPMLVSIGQVIRDCRSEQKISQEKLALASGLDRSYMGGIERGEHNLTVMNLAKIAGRLGISCGELLTRAGV